MDLSEPTFPEQTKNYYLQIKVPHLAWEHTPVMIMVNSDRQKAVEYAKVISSATDKEVRLTDNAKLMGGDYFTYSRFVKMSAHSLLNKK